MIRFEVYVQISGFSMRVDDVRAVDEAEALAVATRIYGKTGAGKIQVVRP